MIEKNFDVPFIASLAMREKQIQQNYRPVIAVHKWFARRPGTLFRGLLLAEFGDEPLRRSFFSSNDCSDRVILDPFMGGGTPLLEANRLGCDVHGIDINPMAAWIVNEEIDDIDLRAYRREAHSIRDALTAELSHVYTTRCPLYGEDSVPVKYFLWVKTLDCDGCGSEVSLFPGFRIADDSRHTSHVYVCAHCGSLNEVSDVNHLGNCVDCGKELRREGNARRGKFNCPTCSYENTYPRPEAGPPRHRLFAIEYFNPGRSTEHRGRFFKRPDSDDFSRFDVARQSLSKLTERFTPEDEIDVGDETSRLHRWGYVSFAQLFNDRQLLGLERICGLISRTSDERIGRALATNLSDLVRYQNMLCRYDTRALKSLDVFSIHGFPVGLIQCESNILGIRHPRGQPVGSGGWLNIIEKYIKAKEYCSSPFEVRHALNRKEIIPIDGEWIGKSQPGKKPRSVVIECVSSTELELRHESVDAIFTDPPYFGMVQYAELMDFCYVWLKKLVSATSLGFDRGTLKDLRELTQNDTLTRGIEHYCDGLGRVFENVVPALKPGAPLAFTFHHNQKVVYQAVAVAMLDASLSCTASIPCPAEMGGSIHIHGTDSSIVDTIFVCRDVADSPGRPDRQTHGDLVSMMTQDLRQLRVAGHAATKGDTKCILLGHLTRLAVADLRWEWDRSLATSEKLDILSDTMLDDDEIDSVVTELMTVDLETIAENGQLRLEGVDATTV